VGDVAEMTIWRNGRTVHIQAVLAEPQIKVLAGAQLTHLFDGAVFTSDQSNMGEKGMQVATVRAGSAAWNSGLREGDVIVSVNRKMVSDPDRFAEEVAKTPERLILNGTRNGEPLVLSISSKGYGVPKPSAKSQQ
jgi:serine protease Do/serine protease DegQ